MQAETVALRLDRLLVETRSRAAATIEAIRADWHEMAAPGLLGHQPAQHLKAELQRSLAMHSAVAAAADQGMRQLRVRVAQHRLEPWPVRRALRVVEVDQPLRQPVADGADVAIAAPDAPGIPAPRSPRMPRLLARLMASSSGRAKKK